MSGVGYQLGSDGDMPPLEALMPERLPEFGGHRGAGSGQHAGRGVRALYFNFINPFLKMLNGRGAMEGPIEVQCRTGDVAVLRRLHLRMLAKGQSQT